MFQPDWCRSHGLIVAALVLLLGTAAAPAQSADADKEAAFADKEAAYLADIGKRADKHVAALKLEDPAKATKVRELIVNQYRSLRTVHDARDAKLRELPKGDESKPQAEAIRAESEVTVKKLHDTFLSALAAAGLTHDQIEGVKDQLTTNRVQVNYNAFCDMLPTLTDSQKEHILSELKEAREIAMDKGSSEEKQAVFTKYRGRINNYLSKQGYDLKQASKDWAERRKARESGGAPAGSTTKQAAQQENIR
jgi:hypothetical protein